MRLDVNKINQFLSDMYSVVMDANSQLKDIDIFRESLKLYNKVLHFGFPLHEYESRYIDRNTIFPAYGDVDLSDTISKFSSGLILQSIVDKSVFITPSGKRMVDVLDVGGMEFTLDGKDVYEKIKDVVSQYGLYMDISNTSPSSLVITFPVPSDVSKWNLVELVQAPATIMQVDEVRAGTTVVNPHPRYTYMYQMGNNELDTISIQMRGLQITPTEYIIGLTYLDIKYREYIPTGTTSFSYTITHDVDSGTMPILITDEPDNTSVSVRITKDSSTWSSDTGGSIGFDLLADDVIDIEIILNTGNKFYTPIFYGIIL